MNLKRMALKIACLSVLMMCSGLRAMDVNPSEQQRLNMELRSAARSGNKQKVEKLIAQGADVGDQNKRGETALIRAAEYGHRNVCELLIAQGADVNARNRHSAETALMAAAINGHEEVCQLLITHGADLYAQDKDGETALKLAAVTNHRKVCKLLINEMIKQEQKQARIALYPILKEHKIMGRDTARLVTQQLQESQKEKKAGYKSRARQEIMKINSTKLEKKLLDYLDSL
jgi:ankyrin repeat protein